MNDIYSKGKLRLNDIKRHSKKQNEHVMDEKFAILFQSKLQVDGKPLSVSDSSQIKRKNRIRFHEFRIYLTGLGDIAASGCHSSRTSGAVGLGDYYVG